MGTKVDISAALAAKGGEEWLWEQLATMRDIAAIAKELGCTPRGLYGWRDRDDNRRAEWAASMRVSGDAYAEEGKGILDTLARTDHGKRGLQSAEVALATARARDRMKIAAARHPEAWGERQPAPVIQVSIGSLHLEALRAHGSMSLQGKPTVPLLEAPARPALYVPPMLDAIVEPEPDPIREQMNRDIYDDPFSTPPAETRAIQTADAPHESAPETAGSDPVSLPEPDPFQAPDRGPIWG